jgi:E3 ubiquitin-protein ligase ZNF598
MASPAGPVANSMQVRSAVSTNTEITQNSRGGPRDRNRNRNQGEIRAGNQGRQSLEASAPQKSRGRGGRQRRRGDFGIHGLSLQDQGGNQIADFPNQSGPPLDPPPGPGGGGTFGSRLTKDAITTVGEVLVSNQAEGGEDEEAEVCFICASPVVHSAVAPCNHHTCHICALRLRALYKTWACAHCRVRLPLALMFIKSSA